MLNVHQLVIFATKNQAPRHLNGRFQVGCPGWIDGPRFLGHGAFPEAAQAHAGLHRTGGAIGGGRRLVEHLLSPWSGEVQLSQVKLSWLNQLSWLSWWIALI